MKLTKDQQLVLEHLRRHRTMQGMTLGLGRPYDRRVLQSLIDANRVLPTAPGSDPLQDDYSLPEMEQETGEAASPEPAESRQTFHERTARKIVALMEELFKETPELRSACVVLDWRGDLNTALPPCLWFDETGPVAQRKGGGDAIVGSMLQLMRAFSHQAEVGVKLIEAYQLTFEQQEQLLAEVEKKLNEQGDKLSSLAERGQRAAREAAGLGPQAGDDPPAAGDQ